MTTASLPKSKLHSLKFDRVATVSVEASAINVLSDALSAVNVGLAPSVPVGIDLSLIRTGVAWRQPNGIVMTQSIKTKLLHGKYDHRAQTERLLSITALLCDALNNLPWPLHVMIEAPAYGALGRAVDLAQLHGAVRVGIVEKRCVFPMYAEALTVRRMVLGSGCKKEEAAEGTKGIQPGIPHTGRVRCLPYHAGR